MTTHPYYRLATVAVVGFLTGLGFYGNPLDALGLALLLVWMLALGEALRWIGL